MGLNGYHGMSLVPLGSMIGALSGGRGWNRRKFMIQYTLFVELASSGGSSMHTFFRLFSPEFIGTSFKLFHSSFSCPI